MPVIALCLVILPLLAAGFGARAESTPPRNPYLADSSNAIGHGTPAQQDSSPVPGPRGPGRRLAEHEINYKAVGPFHFGSAFSSPYPDGRRVLWSNGADRIVKMDHDSFEVLDTWYFPGRKRYTKQDESRVLAELRERSGVSGVIYAFGLRKMFDDLSGVYTLIDNVNDYYIGGKTGVTVYGDTESGNAKSAIAVKRQWQKPESITGAFVGMNMTFDGWIVLATEHGYVLTLKRDFSAYRVVKLRFSEGAGEKATGPTGKGWVRNGFAVDEAGGIYIASQEHMHKVVWDGAELSIAEEKGAWAAEYGNSAGQGTGATPSLMGFGDEDRFVVITDGNRVMNVTLFWRDEIPHDWQPPGADMPRRIAGSHPVTMGDPDRKAVQSEQSVVVSGYGALVMNNMPRVPWWVPDRAAPLLASFLGSREEYLPRGMEKFVWDAQTRTLKHAWVNTEVASPNSMPLVSSGSQMAYTVGVRNGEWTVEGVDWHTGKSAFHYILGDERYNSLFSGVLLDEAGRIFYGTIFGKVRVENIQ